MTDATQMTLEEREATLGGIGSARKRKEDVRFIQGKGNYLDDIKLPGMLFGDFVRSPYAHARITAIDSEAAKAVPGVLAVLTAADGSLSPIQDGFMQEHGLQCGYCTPGMIMRTHRLLQENPDPSDEEIRMGLSGNLCRCTGYQNIVKAVHYAAQKIQAGREAAE